MFVGSQIFRALTFKNNVRLPGIYYALALLRFALTLLPMRGYIHPDEFFQNVEIIAGDIFRLDVARVWEFNPEFPLRNILIPKIIFGPPFHLIRILNPYSKYYLCLDLTTPYFMLVMPRLVMCLLSFINDYCLYEICILYGQNFKNRLVLLASSYIIFAYCCKCFSNSLEMIFFSVLLLIVAKCMLKSDKIIYHNEFLNKKYSEAKNPVDKVKVYKVKTYLPPHTLSHVFSLATLIVAGIFNRPTFCLYAFPGVFFWIHRGLGSNVVSFFEFFFRSSILYICCLPSIILFILVDSNYYGYLTSADVESMKITINNFVVTPLNFIRYNMDVRNLSKHGLHQRWMHVVVNVPMLFNSLGVLAVISVCVHVYRFLMGEYKKLPRLQSITGLMLFSMVFPVLGLSLVRHQEPRFIIPVLIPLVYLLGNRLFIHDSDSENMISVKTVLMKVWVFLNIVLTFFFGFAHQGGIYPFTNNLYSVMKQTYGTHTHVVTSHTYSIPTYLLHMESTTDLWVDRKRGSKFRIAPSTFIYSYGSVSPKDLFKRIDEVLDGAEMMLQKRNTPYRFYVGIPCSRENEVLEYSSRYFYFKLVEDASYYPHFTTEALPRFPGRHDATCVNNTILAGQSHAVDMTMFQRLLCYLSRFCFKVYTVRMVNVS